MPDEPLPEYVNPNAGPVAGAMMRAALSLSPDLNPATEAAAVITVALTEALAREDGKNADELLAWVIEHARELVDARRKAGVAIVTPAAGKKNGKRAKAPSAPALEAAPAPRSNYRRFTNPHGAIWLANDQIESAAHQSGRTRIRTRSGDVWYVDQAPHDVVGQPEE